MTSINFGGFQNIIVDPNSIAVELTGIEAKKYAKIFADPSSEPPVVNFIKTPENDILIGSKKGFDRVFEEGIGDDMFLSVKKLPQSDKNAALEVFEGIIKNLKGESLKIAQDFLSRIK